MTWRRSDLVFLVVVVCCTTLSWSNGVDASGCAPEQIHLALARARDPSRMLVQWFTRGVACDSVTLVRSRERQYGVGIRGTTKSMRGTLWTPFRGDATSYAPNTGYHHRVEISGLESNEEYEYRVGCDGNQTSDACSSVFRFRNQPTIGTLPRGREMNVLVYGDMGAEGSGNTTRHLKNLVASDQMDLVVHVGDISYADDYPADQYESVWNKYMNMMQPIMSQLPYMTCPGNHEKNCGSSACLDYSDNFRVYDHRFRVPSPSSGSPSPLFYSFDYGPIHFISMSSESGYPNCPYPDLCLGDQIQWLEHDLIQASSRRDLVPWIVAFAHRPMYSSEIWFWNETLSRPQHESLILIDAFEELFARFHVDMFFCGHVHAYERSYPVLNGTVYGPRTYQSPKAPVHIVSGSAGSEEGLSVHWTNRKPDWEVMRDYQAGDEGFGILTVSSDRSSLIWRFIHSVSGETVDSIVLSKSI